MSLRILRIPPGAVLVGPPRTGYLSKGIPVGGPFDQFSATLANRAAGNSEAAAVIESLNGPIEFEILSLGRIGVSGARSRLTAFRNNQPIELNEIQMGDRIAIEPSANSARIYVAMSDGFKSESKFGTTNPVQTNDILKCANSDRSDCSVSSVFPTTENTLLARCQPNFTAESDFEDMSIETTVGVHSDRKGVRLHLPETNPHSISMRSEPQCVGAIEWTPNGDWIALGPDGPTIGGYPRIGWIIRSSIATLAQLRPGTTVEIRFVDEARERLENQKWDATICLQIEGLAGIGTKVNPS